MFAGNLHCVFASYQPLPSPPLIVSCVPNVAVLFQALGVSPSLVGILHQSIWMAQVHHFRTFSTIVLHSKGFLAITIGSCAGLRAVQSHS